MPKHDEPVPEVPNTNTMIHYYGDEGKYLGTKPFSVTAYLYLLKHQTDRLVLKNYKIPPDEKIEMYRMDAGRRKK